MLNRYDEKITPLIAFLIALGLHILFFVFLSILPLHRVKASTKLITFRVVENQKPRRVTKAAVSRRKQSKIEKSISKKLKKIEEKKIHRKKKIGKVIDLRKLKKIEKVPPSSYVPEKQEQKKIQKKQKPLPVFGLSPKSVVGKGGAEGFRVGNTLMKEPEKKLTPPEKVKPYTGPPLTPVALVTKLPRFKRMVKPEYPEKLRKMGIEGEVVLDVVVNTEGKAVDIKVVRGNYPEFVSAAIKAIRDSEFYPAEVRGKPVNVRIRIPVKFRLIE